MRRFISLLVLAIAIPAAAANDVQKLEKTLANDRDANARAEAAWQLGQMGAADAVPALIKALKDDQSRAVRANAAGALWHLGEAARPATEALTNALDDPYGPVVGNAAGALMKLGTPKSKLVPVYRRLLARPDCEDRVVALTSLTTEVPASELFDAAWHCSRDEDSDVASEARDALRKVVGRRDRALIPRIIDALQESGSREAPTLIRALGNYDPPAKEAVPVLASLLSEKDENISSAAASALGDMKTAAVPALPDLVKAMQSSAINKTRENAAEAIGKIGPKAPSAVPALMNAVQNDKWPSVRKAAVTALGEMGTAAHDAARMLRKQLESPDDWMRLAARNALFRVEPGKSEEVAKIADEHQFEEKGSLFDDLSQLAATLPARLPEVYELIIYDKFAMATAPQSDSPTGRGKYTYKAGAVTGPEEESSGDCKKKATLASVDFSIVPKLVKQAPAMLGVPGHKVSHVQLSAGIFCRGIGWLVYVEDGGYVEFGLNGKPGKVQKF